MPIEMYNKVKREEGGDRVLKNRYIILALGIVSVLLGSLFVSNLILAQSGGEYDPWLDYNEDGTIDVNDLSPLGEAYGSSGDPTKNVTIKHSYYEEDIYFPAMPPGVERLEFDLTGFRQVSYCIRPGIGTNLQCDIVIGKFWLDQTVAVFDHPTGTWVSLPANAFYYNVSAVSGPTLLILLNNIGATDAAVRVVVYVTT